MKVCVYCASSGNIDPAYRDAARELGALLAKAGITIIGGGGKTGLMGALADGALENGGKVIGIIPRFMHENGWGHDGLTEVRIVASMHQRKRQMIEEAGAFIALPGGCGTFEELFQTITRKQLGLHALPIIIVTVGNFFEPFIELFDRCIAEGFIDERHKTLFTVVASPAGALRCLAPHVSG